MLTPQCSDSLRNAADILITVHRKPDGDAAGSAFAMAEVMRKTGKNVTVLMPEGFPVKYAPLIKSEHTVEIADSSTFDFMLVLDCATPELAGCGGADINELCREIPSLVLDHHPGNTFASALYKVVDSSAAAASLLCFELCREMDWEITPAAATLFLLGLSTDTGGFRFANSDSRAFAAAGMLLELGADLNAVNMHAYFSKPVSQQKLEADMVLNHLEFRCGGRIAIGRITDDMLALHDFDMREGEGIIERIRELQGVEAAILISPRGNGVKLSARTPAGGISAADILKKFGGGGHRNAAGLQINANVAETIEKVLVSFEEELL